MWYIIVNVIFAIWVLVDGKKRKAKVIPWSIGTLLLGPIVLPVYVAKRPLKSDEVREGGTGWNVLRNFAIFWTIFMVVAAMWGMATVSEQAAMLQTDAEKAGTAIGTVLGLAMIAALWFFPMLGALVLGLFLKKSSIVEKGPTGPLVLISEENLSD
jgi:Kef-type K+ transport system membrane component KefB